MMSTQAIYSGVYLTSEVDSSRLWLLLALPLLGALVCGWGGSHLARRWGRGSAAVVAVGIMGLTTVTALVLIARDLVPLPVPERCLHQTLWPLFSVAGVDVTFGLTLDPLSAVMILIVTVVGTLIHLYAAGYMKHEPSLARFFAYLNLFVFSMLLLVLGDGFAPLLFGWEGVGVCSYLLIGFWFRRPAATSAAVKAFVVNRVGDWAFVTGICLLLWGLGGGFTARGFRSEPVRTVVAYARAGAPIELGRPGGHSRSAMVRDVRVGPTLGFRALADQINLEYTPRGDSGRGAHPGGRPIADALEKKTVAGLPLVFVVCVLFFLGAAGKSAQVPLFAWLPDAMAGPTPVSALIHAATMVTAGVYLMARLGFLLALSPGALTLIAVAGTATAFIGATAGCLQWDLKRVLAYSTVSQLGFMFAAVGAGAFQAGVFHVVTHAFFKACLFLAAGSVIHAVNHIESGESSDPQDMRNMGGLAFALPWSRRGYLVACVAIAGFPVASGFFSKDQILTGIAGSRIPDAVRMELLGVLGLTTLLTAFYMFRSYFLVFWARPPRTEPAGATHEPSRRMTAVVLTLAFGSIVVGPILGWPSNWHPTHRVPLLERILASVFSPTEGLTQPSRPSGGVELGVQVMGLVLATLGFVFARALYRDAARTMQWRARLSVRFARPAAWISGGWGFDHLYRQLVVLPASDFARATTWLDHRVFDPAVNAVAYLGVGLARIVREFDRRFVDAAVDGIANFVLASSGPVSRLQSGRIGAYVLGIAAGIAVFAVLAYVLGS